MAKITKSADAPADAQTFSLAGAEFSFENEPVYNTDDAGVISNAVEHPWLDVELEQVEEQPAGEGEHQDPDERKEAARKYAEDNYGVAAVQQENPAPVPVATAEAPAEAPASEPFTRRSRSTEEVV